jgi:hypothetical protein
MNKAKSIKREINAFEVGVGIGGEAATTALAFDVLQVVTAVIGFGYSGLGNYAAALLVELEKDLLGMTEPQGCEECNKCDPCCEGLIDPQNTSPS